MTFIDPNARRGVWDEELMCDVEPVSPVRRVRSLAGGLRAELGARNLTLAAGKAHEVTHGSGVVYAPQGKAHGNFIEASYQRILAREPWRRRLRKAHTAKRQARPQGVEEVVRDWRELDAATSSDALLMNVFCYPGVQNRKLSALLGVQPASEPEFGYKPRLPLARGLKDCSEIDMRLGGLLVEAKLTEGDFGRGALRLVERYVGFEEVFDRDLLELRGGAIESYQVVRGIMAASFLGARYCLLCDGRRRDLLERWFSVVRAVRSFELQSRIRVVTWQEVAACTPGPLREFLAQKYGIEVIS